MKEKVILLLLMGVFVTGCADTELEPVKAQNPTVLSAGIRQIAEAVESETVEEEEVPEGYSTVEEWLDQYDIGGTLNGHVQVTVNGNPAYDWSRNADGDECITVGDQGLLKIKGEYLYRNGDTISSILNPDEGVLSQFFGKSLANYLPVSDYVIIPETTDECLKVDRDLSGGYVYYYDESGVLAMADELPEGTEAVDMTTHYTITVKDSTVEVNTCLIGNTVTYLVDESPVVDFTTDVEASESVEFADVITQFTEAYTNSTQISFSLTGTIDDADCSCGSVGDVDAACSAGCC